jgi:hypothetical protein
MLNDLRYAIRILIKSRGFTIASLTALMLGIGATTAMFSAVNSVLLRPLPFPDAERLFAVRETRAVAGFERTIVSEGEYLQWARNNPLFEHAAVVDMPGLSVRLGDAPDVYRHSGCHPISSRFLASCRRRAERSAATRSSRVEATSS